MLLVDILRLIWVVITMIIIHLKRREDYRLLGWYSYKTILVQEELTSMNVEKRKR